MLLQKRILILMFVLGVIFLFSPIIFMKIGPLGYDNYGPNVPDIFIYGGNIFGKDKSFYGINFACKFQTISILLYLVLILKSYINIITNKKSLNYLVIGLCFALLFPLWLKAYSEGVVRNSDGADLTLYYSWGAIVYLMILFLNLFLVVSHKWSLSVIARKR